MVARPPDNRSPDDLPPDDFPASGQPPAVQAAFLKLREGFLAGLPQRWAAIQSAPSGAALQQALHRLAGAAGSYGCHALGEAARAAEQALTQTPRPDSGAFDVTFSAALQRLEQEMQQARQHIDTV